MAALVSRSERGSLNALFLGAMKRSMLFVLVGSVAILVGLVVLAKMDVVLVYRFSTLPVASCLAVVTVANSFIYAAAAYMRSHKAEPMMWPSIVSGVLVLVGAVVGSSYGDDGALHLSGVMCGIAMDVDFVYGLLPKHCLK